MIDGVEENEREGRTEKEGQGMKVIEKTRWEGGKTVGVKREKKDEERDGWK